MMRWFLIVLVWSLFAGCGEEPLTSSLAEDAETGEQGGTATGGTTDADDPLPDVGPLCECVVDEDCAGVLRDLPPCEIGRCDTLSCECVAGPRKEGDSCEDGDFCTFGTICAGGACTAGDVVQCDDGEFCTQDACHPVNGCVQIPLAGPCDDGDPCTLSDLCESGSCVGTGLLVCVDENPCTDDGCEAGVGCYFPNNEGPCDDGKACTNGDLCENGACVGGLPPGCDDGNVCTADDCSDANGCTNVVLEGACDGGDPCMLSLCKIGECVQVSPVDCEDDNQCTEDACGAFGCVHVPKNCSDGSPCTDDSCAQATGCLHVSVDCDDGNPCTTDQCTDVLGCYSTYHAGACDDGDPCTYGDVCAMGACSAGEPNACDDGNACTSDACDVALGCTHLPVNDGALCEDGNPCTVVDVCVNGICTAEVLKDCEDGNLCTANPCLQELGCTSQFVDAPCDDGDDCTIGDQCAEGVCQGADELDCTDDNVCTADACMPGQGCVHSFMTGSPCDDGLECNGDDDVCKGNLCSGATCECLSAADCPDDADLCNGTPACHPVLKTCIPGSAVICPVSVGTCESHACNPQTGVCELASVWDGASCDDGLSCTADDQCLGGECMGLEVECPDTGPCISSACDPDVGECTFELLNGEECEDDDPCTDTGSCIGGICVVPVSNCASGCAPMATLNCGEVHGSLAGWLGPPSAIPGDLWACTTQVYPGPQWSVEFKPLVDGLVTITLYDEAGTVDLFVLEDASGICDPDACLAHGYESVTFEGIAGKKYHIVFDSPAGGGNDAGVAVKCGDAATTGCVAGTIGGCGGCECEQCVCELDATCCTDQWTSECAALCGLFCEGGCAENEGDCCVQNDGPSCADPACANCVCVADSFCCEVLWDPSCAEAAFDACDGFCGCEAGLGDCCSGNLTPGCDDPGCQVCVCGQDPFCCEASWDFLCAADAAFDGSCGAHCNCAGNAPFNCCQGFASPGCPPLPACEECVCGSDPFCCNVTWDGVCGQKAMVGCPGVCGCPSLDDMQCCGFKLGSSCADPVCLACVCSAHPECCAGAWTESCGKAAQMACATSCGCWSMPGSCCEPQEGPGCAEPACEECLCSVDPFCCNVIWDEVCVAEAAEFCPMACVCPGLD